MEKKHTTAIIVIAALVITGGAIVFIANKKNKAKLATAPDTLTYIDENGDQQVLQKNTTSNPIGDLIDKLFTKKTGNNTGNTGGAGGTGNNGNKDTTTIKK